MTSLSPSTPALCAGEVTQGGRGRRHHGRSSALVTNVSSADPGERSKVSHVPTTNRSEGRACHIRKRLLREGPQVFELPCRPLLRAGRRFPQVQHTEPCPTPRGCDGVHSETGTGIQNSSDLNSQVRDLRGKIDVSSGFVHSKVVC